LVWQKLHAKEKGKTLARSAGKAKIVFKVKVQFESTRLSEECLTIAYELTLPVVSRQIAKSELKTRKQPSSNGAEQIKLAVTCG
jgi:hypothetical protein